MAARRGPKRSEAARLAILEAAAAELSSHGYEGVRMEAIAARAGVGKQTVYRWWPSKGAVIADCLAEGMIPPLAYAPSDTGDVIADITRWVEEAIALIDDDGRRGLMRGLLAAALESPAVAQAEAVSSPVADLRARFAAAQEAGQLRPDADIDTLAVAINGCLVLRVLEPGPSQPDAAQRIVRTLLPGAQPEAAST
ncbi:TetR/AcrR family transcriptional regulator [Microbacterium sp. NPDC019599]|uniref:TetR/AcrR family transcriptional regulator n=1 Tax=Microbacterium sp. NPDC019599 TaxID=3154690 RepID=UPI0033DEC71B